MTIASAPQQTYGAAFAGNLPGNYERYFVPAIGRPLATALVDEAAPRPGDRVLDVACGTGIVARLAAERVAPDGTVAGADLTPGMLAVARAVTSDSPIAVQWYETSAEAMPLPDASFTLVLCQLGLQFMADQRAALREMRRVLVPGGRAYVTVPAPTPFFDIMDAALERHGLAPAAAFVRQVFSLNDPRELERLFVDAGFSGVEVRIDTKQPHLPPPADFVRQYFQSTPIGAAVETLDQKKRAALEREIAESWQPWVQDGAITYAQPILVGKGRR